jgi:streptogramin lyase/plastocyanin
MNTRYTVAVFIILLAGCSASYIARPTSIFTDGPSLTSPEDVNPFNLSTKNVIHKYPMPIHNGSPTQPFYVATGSDKNVWFTERDPNETGYVAKIDQTGIITEYGVPNSVGIDDIAAGTGGTLWFTSYDSATYNFIGKVTTSGNVTEYYLPVGQFADAVAKGPDGNVWFTSTDFRNSTGFIGQITPTGTITEYVIPTHAAGPQDIVTGPDGNLWFAEAQVNKVGKITPSGIFTEYAATTHDAPYFIAAGPDGNLYATSYLGIWRITTAGVITQYSDPADFSWSDIILGPDKQMWFTNVEWGMLQEFNPKTQTFSNAIATGSGYTWWGLTVGGDGDIWIADNGYKTIDVYEEKVTAIGIRLNGELSYTDPNYGFELGYAVGTRSKQTQTISLGIGESVLFHNVDRVPHSAAFLGSATSNSAPWPGTFNGSTTQSPAGTAIGTTGWSTGSLNPNKTSPIYETGLPGFYMIGCQYHYNTNEMRTVIVVH